MPFNIFGSKKKTPDEQLQAIKDLLFPKIKVIKNEDDEVYLMDRSVDANLVVVLQDLQNGDIDYVTETNVKAVLDTLSRARDLLGADPELDDPSLTGEHPYTVGTAGGYVDTGPAVKASEG